MKFESWCTVATSEGQFSNKQNTVNFNTNEILHNSFEEIVKILNLPLLSSKTLGSEIQFSIHWETSKNMSKEFDQNIYTQAFNKNETYFILCLQSSTRDQTAHSVARAWPSCCQITACMNALIKNRNLICPTSKIVHYKAVDISLNLKEVWSC